MIKKDKNKWGSENALLPHKSRLKAKSKILVLGLVLIIVLVGLFGWMKKAQATAYEDCRARGNSFADCQYANGAPEKEGGPPTVDRENPKNPNESAFENAMGARTCAKWNGIDLPWCFVRIAYFLFYAFPAFLLWLSSYFFNVLIDITLSSRLFTESAFIPPAWAVTRDLSNIFFILILLYIAIKIILDLGGSEAKKMIAKVVIIALLINFSMFFTKVVIDTSNILALIFYNKISVCTNRNAETGDCRQDPSLPEYKDVAGGLVSNFDPTKALDAKFFKEAGQPPIPGTNKLIEGEVPASIMFGVILVAGFLMFFAAYALFVSGFCFLGRLIELWILIIFSPFAFMSFTVPRLGKIDYIGWKEWSSSLIKVSFMAPIFMFFLYFIFKLISVKPSIFNGLITKTATGSIIESLLLMILPALLITILLYKATKFAEKGGGVVADFMGTVGKVVAVGAGGVAGGLAIGGAAKGLQVTAGKYSEKIAESERVKGWVRDKKFGADTFQRMTSSLGGRDFDLRKGAVGGFLKSAESVTGLKFGSASKFLLKEGGGYRGDRERAEKKRQERVNKLKVSEDEPLKQELNKKEEEFYEMNNASSHEIEQIEIRRKGARENLTDYEQNQKAARGDREIAKDNLEQIQKTTRGDREIAKDNLNNNTVGTTQEKEYDQKKAAFDAIVASGMATTDPTYIAAEAAKTTAAAAVNAINPAYVAAKDTYDEAVKIINKEKEYDQKKAAFDAIVASGMATTDPTYIAAEAAKTTAAAAVNAINPAYVAAKDTYNEAVKNFKEVNKEYDKRAENVRALTEHRKAIKDIRGTADNFDDTNVDSAVSKARQAASDFAAVVARGVAKTDQEYKDAEEMDKRAKEILNAAVASRDHGKQPDGTFASINDFEDKILPKLREEIEDENRKRLINYAKRNIRGSDDGIINALRTMITTAGDDQASRNAAAHKIIEEVSKKLV